MYKWPHINQFRDVVRAVKDRARYNGRAENGDIIFDHAKPIPTLKFKGTVKLHGTNSAIVRSKDVKYEFQSRERVLTLQQDNAGFMLTMVNKFNTLEDLFAKVTELANPYPEITPEKVVIYGEWAGGNIQKGVAITEVPKFFAIFGVRFVYAFTDVNFVGDDETEDGDTSEVSLWGDIEKIQHVEFPEDRIFNVLRFGQWEFDIDFNHPELVQNKIIELTEQIENECPAGKSFGLEYTKNNTGYIKDGTISWSNPKITLFSFYKEMENNILKEVKDGSYITVGIS